MVLCVWLADLSHRLHIKAQFPCLQLPLFPCPVSPTQPESILVVWLSIRMLALPMQVCERKPASRTVVRPWLFELFKGRGFKRVALLARFMVKVRVAGVASPCSSLVHAKPEALPLIRAIAVAQPSTYDEQELLPLSLTKPSLPTPCRVVVNTSA